jgi:hypothetical protein
MKITTLFLFAFILITMTTFGQNVNYEIISDQPQVADISIMPYSNVYSTLGQTFGAMNLGGELQVRMLPVHLRGSYDYTWLYGNIIEDAYERPYNLELGAEFPFFNKTVSKNKPFRLRSTGYTTITTTYITIPHTFQKMFLARAGYLNYRGNLSHYPLIINDLDPLVTLTGNYTVSGFYAGLSWLRSSNMIVKAGSADDNFGEVRNIRYIQVYADVMIGTPDMGEYLDENGQFGPAGSIYNIADDSDLGSSSLGFRLGAYQYASSKLRNSNGSFLKYEIGIRPGPDGENYWLLVGYGWRFNIY